MAASAAERGMGTTLTDVSWNYAFAELDQIGEFGITRVDLDVTTHDSSDNAMAYLAGILDGGTIPVRGNFKAGDASGQMQAITDCANGTHKTYRITLPNTAATKYTFYGHCSSIKVNPDMKGPIKFSAVFRVSGKPVWS